MNKESEIDMNSNYKREKYQQTTRALKTIHETIGMIIDDMKVSEEEKSTMDYVNLVYASPLYSRECKFDVKDNVRSLDYLRNRTSSILLMIDRIDVNKL